MPSKRLRTERTGPVELPRGIGTRGIKYEGCELAVGKRPYIDDMKTPGMLHAALKLSDHARAEILSINVAEALEEPGVEAVYTAADVPGELRVGLIHKDWPVFIPEGGITSYLGDVLAIVVANDRETARRAAALVRVDYPQAAPDHRSRRRHRRRRRCGVDTRRQRAVALDVSAWERR